MINVSSSFKRELYNGNRKYLEYVDITLPDGIELNLTNQHLWNGGLAIDDAVSRDNSFDVGAAIINKCTVTINNIYDDFSEYDFTNAKIISYVGLGLADGTMEKIRKGTYTVDDAKYNGSIITLSCLDNMKRFDKEYSASSLKYPATLNTIVRDACDRCGVTLQTYSFPHDDFVVQERPADKATTFREVISWVAQIACCFCRCDAHGRLELKWYNQEALEKADLDGGYFDTENSSEYESGDDADGGSFNPWNEGYEYDGGTFEELKDIHHIYSLYSMNISVDDVVITGVRISEKNKEDNKDAITTYQSGTDGYVISIENNELIKGGAGEEIAGWLGKQLIGFRFRKADMSHASNPTIEAGDVGFLTDRKQNTYRIVVSSTKFTTGGSQTTTSSSENPARNSAARFSAETKNYVDYRRDIEKERTDREKALEELKNRVDNSSGLFTTEVTQPNGSTIFYMHDKPALGESMIVWKMTAEAWGVSTDGGKTYNAGMTVDGDTIVRILTAVGVNADWIKTGALRVEKNGKTMVNMDFDTGEVDMVVKSFSLTSGDTIDSIAKEEADKKCKTFTSTPIPPYNVGDIWMNSSTSDIMTCIRARSSGVFSSSDWEKRNKYIDQTAANTAATNAVNDQTQTFIFNKLTNNGKMKGIYMENGELYINATYLKSGDISADRIHGGTLALGGANNVNGKLSIRNASNVEIGRWDKDGIYVNGGSIYSKTETTGVSIYGGNMHLTHGDTDVGYIGTAAFQGYPSYKGLMFELNAVGAYMTWASKTSGSESTYTVRMLYANKTFSKYTAGKLYAGCNMDFMNYEIQNAYINALRVRNSFNIPNNVDCDIYSPVDFHNYELQNAKINNLVGINGKPPFTGQIKVLSSTGGAWGTFTVTDGIITSASSNIIYS